jgi:hypothetical protein
MPLYNEFSQYIYRGEHENERVRNVWYIYIIVIEHPVLS